MPISKKVEGVLDDFFTSGNEYDDNYGDDFDSADSEKDASTSTYKKVTISKKSSPKLDRKGSQTTIESTPRTKRLPEKSFASSSGVYTNNDRVTYSEPLGSSRRHQSGTSYRKSDKGRNGAWYNKKKDHRKMIHNPPPKPRNDAAVVKRVFSANRIKVNTLQNLILELQNEINQLRVENRDLKRSSRIQEKVIRKLDDDEGEIPVLIQKHNSEVRILREKLKRQKEGTDKSQEEIHRKDVEIQRLRDKVKRYEDIVKNKQLDERDRLQQKLRILEADLSDKETKIMELERVVKLSEKSRSREVKEKNDKYKKAVDELKRLEAMQKDLQDRFKEKERELEVQNIYSRRITLKKKANPLGLNSRLEYDLNSERMSRSPNVKFELLENDAKDKEKQEPALNHQTVTKEDSTLQEPGSVPVETMVSALRKQEEDLERIIDEERKRRQYEEDRRKLEEMEERIRQKEEEIKRAEAEREMERRRGEMEREQRLEKQRRKEEEEREEAERRITQQERRRREEELQAIKKLEEDGSKASAEEDLMQKLAEQRERQRLLANDSAERVENEKLQAEKELEEKKQILLQRLRAIDDDDDNNASPTQKKKPIFLESSRGDDDKKNPIKHSPLDFKRRGSKEYKFKKADENLHKGLPAYPDLIEGAKRKDDLLFGEYNPTVGSAEKKRTSRFQKDDKKSTKDDFLFFDTGSDKPAKKEKEKSADFPFFDTKLAKKPESEKTIEKSSSSSSDKQSFNRNRTKSLSDDDSLLFTIGSKKPDPTARKTSNMKASSPADGKRGNGTKGLFGGYEPTFGKPDAGNKKDVISPDSDPFQDDAPKFGRRGVQAKASTADQGFFSDIKNNVLSDSKDLFDDGKKAKGRTTMAVEAVSSFGDDDLEEMVLT